MGAGPRRRGLLLRADDRGGQGASLYTRSARSWASELNGLDVVVADRNGDAIQACHEGRGLTCGRFDGVRRRGSAEAARADCATAGEHCRPNRLVADSELCGDLSERQSTHVESGSFPSDRVRQRWSTGRQARPLSYFPHGAAMHVESPRQFPHGHAIGVTGEQLDTIGDAQTGLRLTRTLTHGTALISDASTPSARPAIPRTP